MSKQQNTDDQMITLVDENGNEQLFKELFTFDSDDWGKSYIFIYYNCLCILLLNILFHQSFHNLHQTILYPFYY